MINYTMELLTMDNIIKKDEVKPAKRTTLSLSLTEEDKNANVEQILIDIKNFHVRNLDNIK